VAQSDETETVAVVYSVGQKNRPPISEPITSSYINMLTKCIMHAKVESFL